VLFTWVLNLGFSWDLFGITPLLFLVDVYICTSTLVKGLSNELAICIVFPLMQGLGV
jgi:hypothetical protein